MLPKKTSAFSDIQNQKRTQWILLIGIILIAANLRAPLTSVGSLISFIRDDLQMSHALAGTITTLPLLAFAILSPFAPKISNRIGMEWTIFLSMIFLGIGIVLRSLFGTGALFVGTMMIGLAIAFGNVLLPAFIKMKFPYNIGLITGLYAVFMNVFGALASGLSVPIASIGNLGWKGSLVFWSLPVGIALMVWFPQLKNGIKPVELKSESTRKKTNVWKSPLAWNITLFMGLQSLVFYTMITWLPGILQSHGYSSNAAGWMLFLMQFAIIPITFIIPVIAERMDNQKRLSAATAFLFIIGIGGLMWGNEPLLPVFVIITGIATGSAFSLSMMFFTLRTKDAIQASEVSGMAQSFGYLLAAVGPVLFGALHDFTEGWTAPLVMLIVVSGIIWIVGVESGKAKLIASPDASKESKALGM